MGRRDGGGGCLEEIDPGLGLVLLGFRFMGVRVPGGFRAERASLSALGVFAGSVTLNPQSLDLWPWASNPQPSGTPMQEPRSSPHNPMMNVQSIYYQNRHSV